MSPDLITSSQAARLLDCSPRTIHRLVTAGRLTPFMVVPVGPHGAYTFHRIDVVLLAKSKRADIERLASLPTRRA